MSREVELNNLRNIQSRMSIQQLKTFKESYAYKCKNGISLIKKKKLEENKIK